jgi:acyl CoA:acetate/3-ketoacid CoA transferase alpha subunit
MRIPAESLSGMPVRDKVVTAAEAVRLIRDGDWVVVEGFVGQCFADELALEQRFLLTGAPRDLGLVFTVASRNWQGRGLDRLRHEGLLGRAVGGHWGLSPELGKMAVDKIAAHNLPQGVVSQLFRDTAVGKPGLLTRVGLGTFVDPRHGGGKINERTTEDRIELITLGGAEYLFYQADRRTRPDGRHAGRRTGFRLGGERPGHLGPAVPVRLLRRGRSGRRVPRLKLSEHLSDRGLAPHIYESRQEAMNWLGKQAPSSSILNR